MPPSERISNTSVYYSPYQLDQFSGSNIYKDCSAVKYYVQAYYFTKWVETLSLDNLKISATNNPEDVDSKFCKNRQEVIKKQVNDSLAQAIRNYAGEVVKGYKLPELTANDWDQILNNVSMVTFMQEIPIGFKVYNNYAIVTSTNNREVIDKNELYFVNKSDDYYHRCYCDKTVGTTDLIGYRSIDFIERGYTFSVSGSEETKYYYLHNSDGDGTLDADITDDIKASMSCYYCIINRDEHKGFDSTDTEYSIYRKAYDTALARERYRANQDVILAKEYAEFEVQKRAAVAYQPDGTKRCDLSTDYGDDKVISGAHAMIGDTVAWEIKIKNVGAAAGKIKMYDKIPDGLIYESFAESGTSIGYSGGYDASTDSINITTNNIPAGGEMKVIIRTKVNKLGTLYNTVILHDEGGIDDIDSAFAKTRAEKTVTITKDGSGRNANVIFVLDQSTSMSIRRH